MSLSSHLSRTAGITAGSVQMPASEVAVKVHKAELEMLPDNSWFLTLSVMGGYCTLAGTIEELRALAGRILDGVIEAGE